MVENFGNADMVIDFSKPSVEGCATHLKTLVNPFDFWALFDSNMFRVAHQEPPVSILVVVFEFNSVYSLKRT